MFRAFFFRRPATPESAATFPLPCGGGLGRGHSPNFGNLSQHPNRPNTSLAACCPLSNSLPRGGRTGRLLGLRVLRENRLYWLLFSFSDGLKSTVANPSCLSNRQNRQIRCNLPPPPWGRAGERVFPEFRQPFPTTQPRNTSLAACCPLSNSLPQERGWGGCWGLRVLQGKQVV